MMPSITGVLAAMVGHHLQQAARRREEERHNKKKTMIVNGPNKEFDKKEFLKYIARKDPEAFKNYYNLNKDEVDKLFGFDLTTTSYAE